jgi:hypothetical protein
LIDFLACFKTEIVVLIVAIPLFIDTKIIRGFVALLAKKDFTIKIGTIFGKSKISMQKWFIAIYLLTTSKKGISSIQLAKHVGVTQKNCLVYESSYL